MRHVLVATTIVAVFSSTAHAQRAFDVVSVKENADATSTGGDMRFLPDGIRVQHLSARFLVTIAYHLQPFQVDGLPDWATRTFYDVQARTSTSATRAELFDMMQAMLADRFKLTFHREHRDMAGFALVSAGTPGPGLRPTTLDCEKTPRDTGCRGGMFTGASLTLHGAPIWSVLQVIVGAISAPVTDETHLTGTYDIDLHWSNDPTASTDAVSIYTALQEQLGLKLERRKVPVDMFIVDRIERPDPD
jgi:uncharacterized protein (TIGR03435 family)